MSAVDPVKLLSYGAIGLGFLLALLAYTLLAAEQKRNQTRPPMIRAIYSFMVSAFLLSLLGFGSELLKSRASNAGTSTSRFVAVDLLEARPMKTVIGDAAASRREIENVLTNSVAAAIAGKCFSKPPDRSFYGNLSALIYKGSGGYANNIDFADSNFDQSMRKCIHDLFRGTSFPEPVGSGGPADVEYWIAVKIAVTPSAVR